MGGNDAQEKKDVMGSPNRPRNHHGKHDRLDGGCLLFSNVFILSYHETSGRDREGLRPQ